MLYLCISTYFDFVLHCNETYLWVLQQAKRHGGQPLLTGDEVTQ